MFKINNLENVFGKEFKISCDGKELTVKRVDGAFEVEPLQKTAPWGLWHCQNFMDISRRRDFESLCEYQNNFIKESNEEFPVPKTLLLQDTSEIKEKLPITWAMYQKRKKPKRAKLMVKLKISRQTIPTKLVEDIPAMNISTAKSGEDVFKVFAKYVSIKHRPALISLEPQLCELLEQFRTQHSHFKAYSCLWKIMKQTQKKNKACSIDAYPQDVPTVQLAEIKTFLATVFRNVVPKELFGTVRNRRAIIGALFEFVTIPIDGFMDLGILTKRLKIKHLSWLRPISDEEVKRSIVGSMLLWFFNDYIAKFLHNQLIIMKVKNQRIIFRRWDWHGLHRQHLKKMRRKKVLVDYTYEGGWKPPKLCYTLMPSVHYSAILMRDAVRKVRPIVTYRYRNITEKNQFSLINTFLRQVYVCKFGTSNLQEHWRLMKDGYSDDEIHFVTTDVRDAYGSIKQEKLLEFIQLLTAHLPDTLKLVKIGLLGRNFSAEKIIRHNIYFGDLPLPFSKRRLFMRDSLSVAGTINKIELLRQIELIILKQRVNIGTRFYRIAKGVPQGAKLSPIFADIYYSYIFHTKIEQSLSPCIVSRYVDDINFVTNDKATANRFFKLTRKGIAKYNCHFNRKTFTNLVSAPIEQYSTCLPFLGMKIDTRNIQLLPDFKEESRQYPPFRSDSYRCIRFIIKEMKNVHSLRLPKIVLDSSINNISTIMKNVTNAFLSHGKYISELLRRLFTKAITQEIAKELVQSITQNSMKNLHKIIRSIHESYVNGTKDTMQRWMDSLMPTVLKAYEPALRYIKSITRPVFE